MRGMWATMCEGWLETLSKHWMASGSGLGLPLGDVTVPFQQPTRLNIIMTNKHPRAVKDTQAGIL
jgi:hypothetical protein